MKALRNSILGLFASLLCVTASAQTGGFPRVGPSGQLHVPPRAQHQQSSMYRYLASDEGRAWMQVSGNPKSKSLNQRFGEPSPAALERDRILLHQMKTQPSQLEPEPVAKSQPCNAESGARFNLEPRVNAVLQVTPTADFIINGAGAGADLIVQTATDARGNLPPGGPWDGSLSGYYVHTSSTADCSVQFEGGLPNFNNTMGLGTTSVVADSVRGAVFAADNRFVYGGAIFRAATADLLNPSKCPHGTHTAAQAESCWMQTPPVQIDPTYQSSIYPVLAVDERSSGTGAGDVYIVGEAQSMFIMACTNSLSHCSAMENVGNSDGQFYAFVQARPDGLITISYMQDTQGVTETVNFVTCTPAGAPKPPVCGTPVTVATVNTMYLNAPTGIAPIGFSYSQHADRLESDGSFTTFLVYDACTNVYTAPPPPNDPLTYCVNTRVYVTFSTDNGQTWSKPVSVDNRDGFHTFPTITNDASTGTVSIVHLSTEGDYFEQEERVVLNQILPGSTALGPSKPVTSFTSNANFANILAGGLDLFMGAIARGTGISGQSHLYLSFNSIAVNGIYNREPVPEMNNTIKLLTY
jgi:hypothetical protein